MDADLCFLIGIGSSVLHPEASRITFLASGGKRGLAQSLFQVGGNLGGSLGPLLVALLVAPYGREHLAVLRFCFGCYRCHVPDLQMVQILSQPNERAKGYSEKGCTFAFTDG